MCLLLILSNKLDLNQETRFTIKVSVDKVSVDKVSEDKSICRPSVWGRNVCGLNVYRQNVCGYVDEMSMDEMFSD